jgi:ABC-2 type transport system ATP-binding protein
MSAVQTEQLRHIYPSRERNAAGLVALDNVELGVKVGEIFGLLGPNGGGKTTLFRILSTALRPTSGSVRVMGLDVVRNSPDVRQKIGVVFQHPSLDKKLTLRENLLHQGHLYGICGSELRTRIDRALSRFRLSDRADEPVERLSGGMQRRGEIAKGLLHEPALLLMDEPSTGLDPGARLDLWGVLGELKKAGTTVLLTTHLMEDAERCDRLAILHEGRCVALGSPSALKEGIGGDVVSVQTPDAQGLCEKIRDKFGGNPVVVDETVRIERDKGHVFLPQLVEAFPGMIRAVTVGKPTLEDVFIHQTGRRFWHENGEGN